MNDSAPLLSVKSLQRAIGKKLIIDDFSYDFHPGRVYTVLGPSGAGKSSLLRLLNRLDEPTGGEVLFHGGQHCDQNPCNLRREIGFLFQSAYMFPGSVRDNLLYANKGITEDRMVRLLSRSAVDSGMLDEPVDNLSGGEAQRVAMARMLATEPSVILLDEPTSALDPAATATIEDSIKRLVDEDKLCAIMVTHNTEQALRMEGTALLLVDGRLVEDGDSQQVINFPKSTEGQRYKNREMQ